MNTCDIKHDADVLKCVSHSTTKYSETSGLGTPKGLWKTVLNSQVVWFLRSISMYWIGLGNHVAVLNCQVVPISQVVLKTGSTVVVHWGKQVHNPADRCDMIDAVLNSKSPVIIICSAIRFLSFSTLRVSKTLEQICAKVLYYCSIPVMRPCMSPQLSTVN